MHAALLTCSWAWTGAMLWQWNRFGCKCCHCMHLTGCICVHACCLQLGLDTRMFLCNASKVTDAEYAQAQVSPACEWIQQKDGIWTQESDWGREFLMRRAAGLLLKIMTTTTR